MLLKKYIKQLFVMTLGLVENIKKALGRLGIASKKNILIDCLALFHYYHVEPLVQNLQQDSNLNIYILENPEFSRCDLPASLSGRNNFISPFQAKFVPFDLTISLDYGEPVWIPHRGIWVHVPHGDGMKANYTGCNRLFKYDVILSFSRPQATLHRRFARPGARVIETGFMLGDQLAEEGRRASEAKEIKRQLRLKHNLPTVLYAPSWSGKSELVMMSEEILRILANQQEFNIIVKPHPNLLDPGKCKGKEWEKVLQELQNDRFVPILDRNAPIYRYMPLADVLLSDISSVIYEFLFLDRPIVVHVNEDVLSQFEGHEYFNEIKYAVRSFRDASNVLKVIKEAIESPSANSEQRKEILEKRFFNIGSATAFAIEKIYELLQL